MFRPDVHKELQTGRWQLLLSHEYGFIFIKTRKTAGTSIEIALSRTMGRMDIVTPIHHIDEAIRVMEGGYARNFLAIEAIRPGFEIMDRDQAQAFAKQNQGNFHIREKYFNHMTAMEVRRACGNLTWKRYHTFCVERIPYDRLISSYHFKKTRQSQLADMSFSEYIRDGDPNLPNYPMYSGPNGVIVKEIIPYHELAQRLKQRMNERGMPFTGLDVHAKSGIRSDYRHWSEVISRGDRDFISINFEKEFEVLGMSPDEAWTFEPEPEPSALPAAQAASR